MARSMADPASAALRLLRQEIQGDPAPPLADDALERRFLESLPFALTGAQSRALAEVDRDLQQPRPMVRLVQGDVGCGKTVVAAAAAARAVGSGLQAALMAPTELLAEQHAKNFERWFRALDIPVALVTGSLPARARRNALAAVANGDINIICSEISELVAGRDPHRDVRALRLEVGEARDEPLHREGLRRADPQGVSQRRAVKRGQRLGQIFQEISDHRQQQSACRCKLDAPAALE